MQQAHQPLYAICFIFIKSNVTAAVFVHKTEKGKEPTLYKVTVLVSGFFYVFTGSWETQDRKGKALAGLFLSPVIIA